MLLTVYTMVLWFICCKWCAWHMFFVVYVLVWFICCFVIIVSLCLLFMCKSKSQCFPIFDIKTHPHTCAHVHQSTSPVCFAAQLSKYHKLWAQPGSVCHSLFVICQIYVRMLVQHSHARVCYNVSEHRIVNHMLSWVRSHWIWSLGNRDEGWWSLVFSLTVNVRGCDSWLLEMV